MTTKTDIAGWFDKGVKQGATHMIVVCDTFDHEDYPVYAKSDADAIHLHGNPGEMQRVMEVYDLRLDKDAQLLETRAMHLPAQGTKQP